MTTRRDFTALAAGALAAPLLAQNASNPNPVLDIAEWSYSWLGVEHATLARGTMCNGMQIYVEHWFPAQVHHPYPVILIHGGYGQGSEWMGWATQLVQQGYKVYVVDRPGQGRCPYHPWVHGAFDREAPTFERVGDPQVLAAMGQPMANNAITQRVWRSRGGMLLDKTGPAILVTRGDGQLFALAAAEERPEKVKGIAALEQTGDLLQWLDAQAPPVTVTSGVDPNRNTESTALKLAEQGCFWVGIQRKQMSYGTIAMGQMFVQYMIPAEKKHPYPVVMVHGGGGQGTHMMGIGGRPGWVHYFVQEGYSVYWVDRPSYGRSPYHPDALGPSHLPNVPPLEGLIQSTAVFNTGQWPGPGGMNDPIIDQFMACESGNVTDEAFHSDLAWRGGAELLDRIGPSILLVHAFGGFFAWGVADRRPNLVKAILCMEINGNPFTAQLRWGLTAGPMTYEPPVTDPSQFTLVDHTEPPDSPRPVPPFYKLQAEPARRWKNLASIPIGWLTSEFGGGGSPVANIAFLRQVGCDAEMIRLRDYGIQGNGNLMLLDNNNHEVFGVIRDWLERNIKS